MNDTKNESLDDANETNGAATEEKEADNNVIELAASKAAIEKANQELLYQRAEFENTKRRLIREQDQAIKFANDKLIGDTLSVLDLMDRAVHSSAALKTRGDAEVTSFVTGVELTHRELINLLGRFGVEFIGSKGEKFDPSRHEAISQMEVDSERVDTVIDVAQRGCMLHGRLLKPAKVVVGTPRG